MSNARRIESSVPTVICGESRYGTAMPMITYTVATEREAKVAAHRLAADVLAASHADARWGVVINDASVDGRTVCVYIELCTGDRSEQIDAMNLLRTVAASL